MLLSLDDIQYRMSKIDGWELDAKSIRKTVKYPTFMDAINAVVAVAKIAEEANHHPDIDIRYDKVRFTLSTHSEGGLTIKDFDVASKIDELDPRQV